MTMTKQDRICMISLFAVMLVLMGVPALCLSTNTVVDELGTLTNTALLTGRNWGTGITVSYTHLTLPTTSRV